MKRRLVSHQISMDYPLERMNYYDEEKNYSNFNSRYYGTWNGGVRFWFRE